MSVLGLLHYSVKQTAEILSNELGVACTERDIYDLAKDGDLLISFYRPDLTYVYLDDSGHELVEEYCEPLGQSILMPKKGGVIFDENTRISRSNSRNIFPIIRKERIAEFVDYGLEFIKEQSSYLIATDKDGNLSRVALCWVEYLPDNCEHLEKWAQQRGIGDIHANGEQRYFSIGGAESFYLRISTDDLVILRFSIANCIEKIKQRSRAGIEEDQKSEDFGLVIVDKYSPKIVRRLEIMKIVKEKYPNLKTKREIFEKCQKEDIKLFSVSFESFSTGKTAIWKQAKQAGITWLGIG